MLGYQPKGKRVFCASSSEAIGNDASTASSSNSMGISSGNNGDVSLAASVRMTDPANDTSIPLSSPPLPPSSAPPSNLASSLSHATQPLPPVIPLSFSQLPSILMPTQLNIGVNLSQMILTGSTS